MSCFAADRERDSGLHASFKVKKKVFAYFLSDHHGDGIVGVTCKVLPGDNAALIKADPKRFHMPAYVGSRGWVGLRLDVGKVDWGEVQELVVGSYQLIAGKRLLER
jgi:predicted DNA-binding protein (MmcQ/YjbR family)